MATHCISIRCVQSTALSAMNQIVIRCLRGTGHVVMCSPSRYRSTFSTRLTITIILVIGVVSFTSLAIWNSKEYGSYVEGIETSIWPRDKPSSGNMYVQRPHDKRMAAREHGSPTDGNVSSKGLYPSHQCTEQKHVYYIKLHKTGSGTLSNIFLRFGLSRNLSFAIPQRGIQFPYEKLQVNDIMPLSKDKYDFLIHHSTFNPAIKSSVFPQDVKTVASFRQPFSLFVSIYNFFHLRNSIPKTRRTKRSGAFELEQYIKYVYNGTLNRSVIAGNPDVNKLSMRLGVPLSKTRNKEYVKHFTQTVLDKEIDFVTIQGYFDESLVLLKRQLCWQTKDILYRGLHFSSHTSTKFQEIAVDVQSMFKEVMSAEYIIFNRFQTEFLKAMREEGSDFFDEVRDFKIILDVVKGFCDGYPVGEEVKIIPRSSWSNQFRVTVSDCNDMLLRDRTGIEQILTRRR